ncbi:MAG: DUF488 family protein [Rubrivivax sp.]|nr:MAG: DUF488 family protein [Rubrivivax sp.]
MTVRIVRLGSARLPDEGLRIGTVRRPPRGVPKAQFASGNWYDVWYPELAPSADTVKQALTAETPAQWHAFVRRYRAEMATPQNRHTIALMALMSHSANFSVGCYCIDESRCHRGILRGLLADAGAHLA